MSEKKKAEDILKLTPEMLEQISGGVMTDGAETVLNALIAALKKDPSAEHTPDEAIDFVTSRLMGNVNFEGVTAQDVEDFIRTNW